MNDQVCTANQRSGEAPPNPLFIPPCVCARCAPTEIYNQPNDDGWLRVRGHTQRYRVEPVELGEVGRSLLG